MAEAADMVEVTDPHTPLQVEIKDMTRTAPPAQDSSLLKAAPGGSPALDASFLEAVQAVGTQCRDIDAVVHSVQDVIMKMSQHIEQTNQRMETVDQKVAQQNGAIATCTQTLSEELRKMEEKAEQYRAAGVQLAAKAAEQGDTPLQPQVESGLEPQGGKLFGNLAQGAAEPKIVESTPEPKIVESTPPAGDAGADEAAAGTGEPQSPQKPERGGSFVAPMAAALRPISELRFWISEGLTRAES